MEKDKIGAILKQRIKEQGYSQEEFAVEVGMGLSTLKKYISGKCAYSYEMLILFAEKLECSYDYLLGMSKSPNREFHEIIEQTRLSEEAVAKITKYAKMYNEEFEARRYIKTLDLIMTEDGMLNSISNFFVASKYLNNLLQELGDSMVEKTISKYENIRKMDIEDDIKFSLETQYMIDVIMRLKHLKMKITPELIQELKDLDTEENVMKCIDKLKAE